MEGLGNDPEIKQTQNGKNIARLSIATSDSWKDKNTGEKKEKTEWHKVVVFNEGLVNVIQKYLKKGAQVYIEGQLNTNKYTDANGEEKFSTQIVLQGYNSSLTILSNKNTSDINKIENNQMSQENIEDISQDSEEKVPF